MAISVEEMGRPIEPLNGSSGGLMRSEEHTSELQSQSNLVCRLLLEKKKQLRGGHHLVHIENEKELLDSIINDTWQGLDTRRGRIDSEAVLAAKLVRRTRAHSHRHMR